MTNAAGVLTDTYDYTAFGELSAQTGTTTNNYLYTGQQFDALSGQYYLRARYYQPGVGRFISRDSAALLFSNPIELNRYGYVANNPINLSDPSGNASLGEYAASLNNVVIAAASSQIGRGAALGYASFIFMHILAVSGACGSDMQQRVEDMTPGQFLAAAAASTAIGAASGGLVAARPAVGVGLGVLGYAASGYDVATNGPNLCNVGAMAVSGAGIAGGLSGGSLRIPLSFLNSGGGLNLGSNGAAALSPALVSAGSVSVTVSGAVAVTGAANSLFLFAGGDNAEDSGGDGGANRSEHAEQRRDEGRPVGNAFNDAQRARKSDVSFQDHNNRWIVRFRGREHIFEIDGTHITSYDNRSRSSHLNLIARGDRRTITFDEFATFQRIFK